MNWCWSRNRQVLGLTCWDLPRYTAEPAGVTTVTGIAFLPELLSTFEDQRMDSSYWNLVVWQSAMDLVDAVYRCTKAFPPDEIYGLVADASRRCFGPQQYRPGKGTIFPERTGPIPVPRERFAAGTSDTDSRRKKVGLPGPGRRSITGKPLSGRRAPPERHGSSFQVGACS
jgi:hypothetical protein